MCVVLAVVKNMCGMMFCTVPSVGSECVRELGSETILNVVASHFSHENCVWMTCSVLGEHKYIQRHLWTCSVMKHIVPINH